MINIKNVSKSYFRAGQEIKVLINLSLSVEKGSFIALMGPSGSGKSTLLNLIAGIDQPDSGQISINENEISKLSEYELAKWRAENIGFIFQFYNLIPVLNVLENVELPLQLFKNNYKTKKEKAIKAIKKVGLMDRLDHKPNELSGGQQQRVAIARALVTEAPLIVADEPTGDLDRNSAEDILTLLQELNKSQDRTIVMVTHDPKAAKRASSQVLLEKGQLTGENPS
ncbi:MAG: ABC transporter ATP-binding protein [Betaproteobacteria bacterium TMED156]|nr:MAG: ABC transporter ATP-binding protein [Betaproteobacteria bacterium TMED156]